MKIKQQRDDFVVQEISSIPMSGGAHAIYHLRKSGIGTAEALDIVARVWGIPRRSLRFAGRKDRHAVTIQKVSIEGGPKDAFEAEDFGLQYLGQAPRPITAQDIEANRFQIRVRGLSLEKATLLQRLMSSDLLCVPNYFGPQRFGSVAANGEFVAQPWCLGNYERALYLALAEDNAHDSPHEKTQKDILKQNWGNWIACKQELARSNRRSVITYLVDHPQGFKKAVALIDRDMRSLYVSAFQSRLWNRIVALRLRELNAGWPECDQGHAGTLVFPHASLRHVAETDIVATEVESPLRHLRIPLPSSRPTRWPEGIRSLAEQAAGEFGLRLHQLRFSHPRDVFFSRAQRDVLMTVQESSAEVQSDELAKQPEQYQVALQFQLPAGQYATTLLSGLEGMLGD